MEQELKEKIKEYNEIISTLNSTLKPDNCTYEDFLVFLELSKTIIERLIKEVGSLKRMLEAEIKEKLELEKECDEYVQQIDDLLKEPEKPQPKCIDELRKDKVVPQEMPGFDTVAFIDQLKRFAQEYYAMKKIKPKNATLFKNGIYSKARKNDPYRLQKRELIEMVFADKTIPGYFE